MAIGKVVKLLDEGVIPTGCQTEKSSVMCS